MPSAHLPCANLPWGLSLWNGLCGASRCAVCMNVFSACWRSKASRSTPGYRIFQGETMYDVHRELIEMLAATPETLTGLLRGIDDAQARAATGGDEGWSVIEVICHLRDAEEIGLGRMRAMRDQDNPKIIGFDQDALAREKKYAEDNLASAFADF